MGALTYRERPCRSRAAEQRHELATLQWTGLHPLTLARHRGSIADWRASSQGLLRARFRPRLLPLWVKNEKLSASICFPLCPSKADIHRGNQDVSEGPTAE